MKINKLSLNYQRSISKLQRAGRIKQINHLLSELGKIKEYPDICFDDVHIDSKKVGEYITFKLIDPKLITSLVYLFSANKEADTFCLPRITRNFLNSKDVKINTILSDLNWKFLCFKYSSYMIIQAFKFVFSNATLPKMNEGVVDLYLHKVPSRSLYSTKKYPYLKTALLFFSQRKNLNKITFSLIDNEKIDFDERAIITSFPFWGFSLKQKAIILLFAVKLFIASLANMIFGSGLLSFLSHEILMKKKAQLVDARSIAKEYVFTNSFIAYYPAWMETLESRGAHSLLYFYSLHCLPYVKKGKKSDWHFWYSNISWPNILLWDQEFNHQISEVMTHNLSIELSTLISLTDKDVSLPESSFDIVVFDIYPVRKSKRIEYGVVDSYIDDDFYISFLKKIINAAEQTNKTIIYKTKRSSVPSLSKRASKYLASFISHPLVTVVDPDVAAYRIIKNCTGVISIPFTSTAKIAEHLKKPSIYFDPTGEYNKVQEASLGIEIINNKASLIQWMKLLGK